MCFWKTQHQQKKKKSLKIYSELQSSTWVHEKLGVVRKGRKVFKGFLWSLSLIQLQIIMDLLAIHSLNFYPPTSTFVILGKGSQYCCWWTGNSCRAFISLNPPLYSSKSHMSQPNPHILSYYKFPLLLPCTPPLWDSVVKLGPSWRPLQSGEEPPGSITISHCWFHLPAAHPSALLIMQCQAKTQSPCIKPNSDEYSVTKEFRSRVGSH